jgi:hypothetical protein
MIGTLYAEEGVTDQFTSVANETDENTTKRKGNPNAVLDNYKLQRYYSWRGGIFKRGRNVLHRRINISVVAITALMEVPIPHGALLSVHRRYSLRIISTTCSSRIALPLRPNWV